MERMLPRTASEYSSNNQLAITRSSGQVAEMAEGFRRVQRLGRRNRRELSHGAADRHSVVLRAFVWCSR